LVTYLRDLQQALHAILAEDERVYLLGEDILDPYGGAYKVTLGLSSAFPERVLTTPISEAAVTGIAAGMALRGMKPIVEIMFGDFITLAADQIINYAAKFRRMYNNRITLPMVIRTPMGGGRGYGPTHSQSLEKLFLGIPHLKVIAPSIFHRPGRILQHAIREETGPVLFIEHKLLYAQELAQEKPHLHLEMDESIPGYPTGVVRNYDRGTPDVTLITYGGQSLHIERLFDRLAREEIRAVACVPASIQPLPIQVLARYAEMSGRAVVVEEGTRAFGWGAEVAAALSEMLWRDLSAPVRRIGAADTIVPAAKNLEAAMLPSLETIEKIIYEVL